MDKAVWDEQLEQDSWAGQHTVGTGQLGQDSFDRTAGTRQLGQDSQDRKAGTGELGQESQKDRRDSTARKETEAEWPEYESKDRTTWMEQPWRVREDI